MPITRWYQPMRSRLSKQCYNVTLRDSTVTTSGVTGLTSETGRLWVSSQYLEEQAEKDVCPKAADRVHQSLPLQF